MGLNECICWHINVGICENRRDSARCKQQGGGGGGKGGGGEEEGGKGGGRGMWEVRGEEG